MAPKIIQQVDRLFSFLSFLAVRESYRSLDFMIVLPTVPSTFIHSISSIHRFLEHPPEKEFEHVIIHLSKIIQQAASIVSRVLSLVLGILPDTQIDRRTSSLHDRYPTISPICVSLFKKLMFLCTGIVVDVRREKGLISGDFHPIFLSNSSVERAFKST